MPDTNISFFKCFLSLVFSKWLDRQVQSSGKSGLEIRIQQSTPPKQEGKSGCQRSYNEYTTSIERLWVYGSYELLGIHEYIGWETLNVALDNVSINEVIGNWGGGSNQKSRKHRKCGGKEGRWFWEGSLLREKCHRKVKLKPLHIQYIAYDQNTEKRKMNHKHWQECGENGSLVHCWWEYKMAQLLWKIVWRVLKKSNIKPYMIMWFSNSTPEHVPETWKQGCTGCTGMKEDV